MRRSLPLLLVVLLIVSACMARRAGVEDVIRPLPAGINPLTAEQDAQLGG